MTASRVLFWHRRDLRLADNLGLQAAEAISPAVTGVYLLDPALIHPPESLPPMAPARLWFLVESLRELQRRWRDVGSRLLVVAGDPVQLLPRLASLLEASAVVWSRDVEPMHGNATVRWPKHCKRMVARCWWIGISCCWHRI